MTALTFLLVGVGLNLAAVATGAQDGGGSSVASLALLASLSPFAFAVMPGPRARPVAGMMITTATAATLLVVGDGHGVAIGVGLLLGVVGMPYARSRRHRGLVADPIRAHGHH